VCDHLVDVISELQVRVRRFLSIRGCPTTARGQATSLSRRSSTVPSRFASNRRSGLTNTVSSLDHRGLRKGLTYRPIMSICPWFHFYEGNIISPQNEIGNTGHCERNCVQGFLFSEVLPKVKARICGQSGYFFGLDLQR
jgi:hypothetical protein